MRRLLLFFVVVAMGLFSGCGSAARLEGVSLGDIEFEGEHAEDVVADLEKALTSEGAALHQAGQPNLTGTLTWEWAGEGATPYPTLVKVFVQSDPEVRQFTLSARYEVAKEAQPRDIAHYRAQLVERIVGRIVAQNREAS